MGFVSRVGVTPTRTLLSIAGHAPFGLAAWTLACSFRPDCLDSVTCLLCFSVTGGPAAAFRGSLPGIYNAGKSGPLSMYLNFRRRSCSRTV
ncbi:Hypothetical predicted protein, partial [Pelobates cultripes]